MVTHGQVETLVRYLCEQVAVMRNGQMVEYGDTRDVLRSPRESYTRDLIAAMDALFDADAEAAA